MPFVTCSWWFQPTIDALRAHWASFSRIMLLSKEKQTHVKRILRTCSLLHMIYFHPLRPKKDLEKQVPSTQTEQIPTKSYSLPLSFLPPPTLHPPRVYQDDQKLTPSIMTPHEVAIWQAKQRSRRQERPDRVKTETQSNPQVGGMWRGDGGTQLCVLTAPTAVLWGLNERRASKTVGFEYILNLKPLGTSHWRHF